MVKLGDSVLRLEDEALVSGGGTYVADLVDSDTLHCAFVRSQIAHGTFEPPDLNEALKLPGVVAAFLAADLDLPDLPSSPGRGAPEAIGMGQPPLARERVRHVGEPIAVVVARTAAQAVDGAESVWVDIDPLPAVIGIERAFSGEGEGLLFPGTGSNIVEDTTVISDGPPPQVEVETHVAVDIPRVSPATIEPLAILVRPRGDGLEVWCGHQSPGRLPRQLSPYAGVPPESIRARVPDVGGAFGTKGQLYPEYAVVAAVARRLRKPVVWLQRRGEQLRSGTHGRSQRVEAWIGGDKDGQIRSLRSEMLGDVGAYPSTGSRIPYFSQYVSQGLYDIEHLNVRAAVAVTNSAPTGPYRGAGRPEAAITIERAVDAFAAEIGMPPEDVRKKNFIRPDQLPFTTQTGAIYDSGDYASALDLALETADVDRWRAEQEKRRQTGANPIGVGIATFVERAGGALGSGEWGNVSVLDDGTVVVRTGSTSAGQAHRTVWSQIAASVFGVPMSQVTFLAGDTDEVAQSVGSFASRSLQLGGSAILRTAHAVRKQILELASAMLEAAEEDLELVDGVVRVVGSPGSELTLAQVSSEAASTGVDLAAEEMFDPGAQTFPYGAYVAVVEVDLETGLVVILQMVAVDDCGNVINPMVVEGQVHGAVVQGVGQALLEAFVYDEDGQPLTTSFVDYLIPSATQSVPLVTRRTTHPAPSNPLGAKGAGEAGCIGAPPAILNAVHDALRPLGVDSLSFPLTPARVWGAMESAKATEKAQP